MLEKIKCPYCEELINSSSEKCPYCAEKLNIENIDGKEIIVENENFKKVTAIKSKNQIFFELSENISNHMEFLGYKKDSYEDNIDDSGRIRVIFSHEKNPNLTINIFKNDLIILSSSYSLGKHYNEKKNNIFYKTINEINALSFITKWYKLNYENSEDTINIEMRINGYNKNIFINDFDLMLEEINLNLSKISDLLD